MSHLKVLFRAVHKSQVNHIALRPHERTQNGSANRIDYKYRRVDVAGIFRRDKYSGRRLFHGGDYYRGKRSFKIVREVIHEKRFFG